MTTKICSGCGKEKNLLEFSRCKKNKDGLDYRCKKCVSIYVREHYENNKERRCKTNRLWVENNKERKRETCRLWRDNNKKRMSETGKLWIQNNKDSYLEIIKKSIAKRKRNLGYNPLNEKFPGSVGHHISKDLVIYIPEELHKSIPHRYDDPFSMGEINALALESMMLEVS